MDPRLLIIADANGLHGVYSPKDLRDEARIRKMLCLEVNAVAQGAFDGGAKEIYVRNRSPVLLDNESLDPRIQLIEGTTLASAGLEILKPINVAFLIGCTAASGNAAAIQPQTIAPGIEISLNGEKVDEAELLTYTLAEHRINVALVSGDSVFAMDYKKRHGQAQVIFAKAAQSGSAGISGHHDTLRARFHAGGKRALANWQAIERPTLTGHYECIMRLPCLATAQCFKAIPWCTVNEDGTIQFYVSSMTKTYQFLWFIAHTSTALAACP